MFWCFFFSKVLVRLPLMPILKNIFFLFIMCRNWRPQGKLLNLLCIVYINVTHSSMYTELTKFCTNCLYTIFQKLHFQNLTSLKELRVIILHSKPLKKCHKNFESRSTYKNLYARKYYFDRAFPL